MSINSKYFPDENFDITKQYVITREEMVKEIACGERKNNNYIFWFAFAVSRFKRNQGGYFLAVNLMCQRECGEDELILIPEDEVDYLALIYIN